MNHYQPLEVKIEGEPTGIFHMTMTNDGNTWPIGYCALNDCQHVSPEEASDCYRKYCIEEQDGMMAGFFRKDDQFGTVLNITSSF